MDGMRIEYVRVPYWRARLRPRWVWMVIGFLLGVLTTLVGGMIL